MKDNLKIGMQADLVCYEPDGNGGVRVVWKCPAKNVVVNQGKGQIINRALGFQTASTFGPYLAAHSASSASDQVWSNISASQVVSYGNNVPQLSFATTHSNGLATGTASFGFTASTQTLSGFALLWHTTNTLSTNAATAGIAMLNNMQLAASQTVQSNNTITVSATVSFA